jgi:hypothetical protein
MISYFKNKKKYLLLSFLFSLFFLAIPAHSAFAFSWTPFADVQAAVREILVTPGVAFFAICAWFTWAAGTLLNFTVWIGVTKMGSIIYYTPEIRNAWAIFRDVINLFFIFGILYLSISTIIGGWTENSKKRLGMIIMSAVLINFSFFFTTILIDLSNYTALHFYENMRGCEIPIASKDGVAYITPRNGMNVMVHLGALTDGGLSSCFMNKFGFPSFYEVRAAGGSLITGTVGQQLISYFLGGIFMIVASVVFFAMAAVILSRFIALLFLIIASPIFFGGLILPLLKPYSDKWVKSLTDNLVTLPVMFLFIYIAYQLAGPKLLVTTIDSPLIQPMGSAAWSQIGSADDGGVKFLGLIINFVIINTFLIGAVVVAKNSGDAAAEKGVGKAAALGGFLGRRTLGRFGKFATDENSTLGQSLRALASSDKKGWKGFAERQFGRRASDLGKFASGSSFDFRNSQASKSIQENAGLNFGPGSKTSFDKISKVGEKEAAEKAKRYSTMSEKDENAAIIERARQSSKYKDLRDQLDKVQVKYKAEDAALENAKKDFDSASLEYEKHKNLHDEFEAKGQVFKASQQQLEMDKYKKAMDSFSKASDGHRIEVEKYQHEIKRQEGLVGAAEKEAVKEMLNTSSGLVYKPTIMSRLTGGVVGQRAAAKDRFDKMYESQESKAKKKLIEEFAKENKKLEDEKSAGGVGEVKSK